MVGYDWCVSPDNCQLTCLALDKTQLLWMQTCRHRWLILFHSMQLSVFWGPFPSPFCRAKVCWILLPLLRASGCAFFQSRLGLVPSPKAMFGFPLPLPFTSDQHGHFLLLLQMGCGPCLLLGLFVLGCLHLLFLFLLPFHQQIGRASCRERV